MHYKNFNFKCFKFLIRILSFVIYHYKCILNLNFILNLNSNLRILRILEYSNFGIKFQLEINENQTYITKTFNFRKIRISDSSNLGSFTVFLINK